MNNESIIRLYNNICNNLFRLDLPNGSKNTVKTYIEDAGFLNSVNRLAGSSNYSCSSVLLLCQSLMNELAEDNIPQSWLEYIYQYALSKSFPMPLKQN